MNLHVSKFDISYYYVDPFHGGNVYAHQRPEMTHALVIPRESGDPLDPTIVSAHASVNSAKEALEKWEVLNPRTPKGQRPRIVEMLITGD